MIGITGQETRRERANNTFHSQFSVLLINIIRLLDSYCKDKLEVCKEYCCNLKISDDSDQPLFSDKQVYEIEKCKNFHELFLHLRNCWNWDEFHILERIVDVSELQEAEDELTKYKKFMASKIGMEIISETQDDLPINCIKLLVTIDKSYAKLTAAEYIELKEFIFSTLEVKKYIARPFIKFLFSSLHIMWYIPKQAAAHVIKMAKLKKYVLLEGHVILVKVDEEVIMEHRTEKVCTFVFVP